MSFSLNMWWTTSCASSFNPPGDSWKGRLDNWTFVLCWGPLHFSFSPNPMEDGKCMLFTLCFFDDFPFTGLTSDKPC